MGAGVVVRYNGGAQAGHNVVTPDGRHHTFSQFGAGTFVPGTRTYLSRYVVIHPSALLVEGDVLAEKGVRDIFSRLRMSEQALVITPFHQAANHIREILRGAQRHGSCGVGVGEAVEDAFLHSENRILAADLTNPTLLRRKLSIIRAQKREQIAALCKGISFSPQLAREWEIFEREELIDTWIASIARIGELGLVVPDTILARWLGETETAVFEGAQGVLLDAEAGFHPYTTWSRCTTENATNLIAELAPEAQVSRIGVMRTYAVRHGPGPLPTETDILASIVVEHNQYGEWQGTVRYGWFDAVLARYALQATGGVDMLALTHLDILPRLETWPYCEGYKDYNEFEEQFIRCDIADGVLTGFRASPFLPLPQRERLTQALFKVKPDLGICNADDRQVIQKVEALTGKPVGLVSSGPSAKDVRLLNPLPQ